MSFCKRVLDFFTGGSFIVGLTFLLQAGQDRALEEKFAKTDVVVAMCLFGITAVLLGASLWWQRSIDRAREEQCEEKIYRFYDEAEELLPPHSHYDERSVA